MAATWAELGEQGGAKRALALAARAPAAGRGQRPATRSVSHQMSSAKFPVHRDLASFDFEVSPVDRKLVTSWPTASSRPRRTTRCWWAVPAPARPTWPRPSAWRASRDGKRVRFYSTVDLVNALEREKAEGARPGASRPACCAGPGDPR